MSCDIMESQLRASDKSIDVLATHSSSEASTSRPFSLDLSSPIRKPAPLITRDKQDKKAYIQEQNKRKETEARFVREHFHMKECTLFLPRPGQFQDKDCLKAIQLRCQCGEILSGHAGVKGRLYIPPEFQSLLRDPQKMIQPPLPQTSYTWSEHESIQTGPTNAFGSLHFNVETIGGKKAAKYVRVSNEDSVSDVLELMTKHWDVTDPQPPSLIISVVGGAKNFQLDSTSGEIFNSGLIKAAKSTKAWLITSGTNMGVVKIVGQAVHKGQSFVWLDNQVTHLIRCIGITPWGCVNERQKLENPDGKAIFHARHRIRPTSNELYGDRPATLNPYHTHFIFVDDGYRIEYGSVAEFRANLERKISSPVQDGGLGIPVVQLLLEGGVESLVDVSTAVSKGTPVIICAGSGRAANIIAYAYKHTIGTEGKERIMPPHHQDKLARKLYATFPETFKNGTEQERRGTLEDLMNIVISCCQREELITIFNFNKHEEELDMAILSVLLKGRPLASTSMLNQLQLAMTWNRSDIVQTMLFREDVNWEEGSLETAFTLALEENKHEFVKLLLNNGIVVKEYLTSARLENLYNYESQTGQVNYLQMAWADYEGEYFTLDDINAFLRGLLDRYEEGDEKTRKKTRSKVLSMGEDEDASYFVYPYKQLLVWAVINRREELARLFWELGDEPVMSALVASRLCDQMESKLSKKYLQTARYFFNQDKRNYERLAISVLDECHAKDPVKANKIIERPSPIWSQLTCLQVATAASHIDFVSSDGVQNSISNMWKKRILSPWPKIILAGIFPPLIFHCVQINHEKERKPTRTQQVISFYSAPVTKFLLFNLSYALFLLLFSYMLLVEFNEKPSPSEKLCVLWFFSIFAGIVHSFITFPSPTFGSKLRDYFGLMDRLDLINLLLALIAHFVRMDHMLVGKTIYCINCIFFFIRILKIYTGNRILGPKIYMIKKMVPELIMFVMVLMVFLLAYGVASQGLLYKHRPHDWAVLRDVLYFPYWQLYGEIFLEEIETDEACLASLRTSMTATTQGTTAAGDYDIPDTQNTCRTYHALVPVLLALYLLVGNILLLSILIAILGTIFEQVTKYSVEIWKFQMYFLAMEFDKRPALPPPFSLLSYAFYLVRWVYFKIPCRFNGNEHLLRWIYNKIHSMNRYTKRETPDPQQQFLTLFEKEMMANMLRNQKIGEMNTVDRKLDIIEDRLDDLAHVVEEEVLIDREVLQGGRPHPHLQTQYSDVNLGLQTQFAPGTSRQQPGDLEQRRAASSQDDTNSECKSEPQAPKRVKKSLRHEDKRQIQTLPKMEEGTLSEKAKDLPIAMSDEENGFEPKDTLTSPNTFPTNVDRSNKASSTPPEPGPTNNPPPSSRPVHIEDKRAAWRQIAKSVSVEFQLDGEERATQGQIYKPRFDQIVRDLQAGKNIDEDSSSDDERVVKKVRNRHRKHTVWDQFYSRTITTHL